MADLAYKEASGKVEAAGDEPSREEKVAVDYWASQVKRHEVEHKRQCEDLEKMRGYMEGRIHDDGKSGLVRAHLLYATMATLIPYVYAKDPDVSVQLTEAVTPDVYELFRGFAKTAEIVLKHELVERGSLKKRMKSAMRAAFGTRVGWLKLVYQRDYNTDPLLRSRMNDASDNLARVQTLIKSVTSEVNLDKQIVLAQELEAQVMSLKKQVEIPLAEGLAIDRIRAEDVIILDHGLQDFDEYEKARAIDHVVWMSPEDYSTQFGVDLSDTSLKKPTIYTQKSTYSGASSPTDTDKREFMRVHEIWVRTQNTIYTIADGYQRFCRAPYQPQRLGRRWYPFFALAFYPIEGRFQPLALPELLMELVDEYNTTRTQYAEHRQDSMPVRVVRKGGSLSEEDVKAIQHRRALDIIAVEGTAGVPISQDIGFIPNAQLDPAVYDVTQIRNDIDLVSGISDASRSNLIDPKTATEAEILREGMMTRTNEMQDVNEDLISDMADQGLQMLLLELTEAQVVRIAGPQAVWPRMAKEDVYNMVRVRVRAGSTGKPNRRQEREQWLQLLPQMQTAIQTVGQLMAQGMTPIADAVIELLKETLSRFDEKLDIEKFFPFAKSNDPSGAGQGLAGVLPSQGVPPEQVAEQQQAYEAALGQVAELEAALADKTRTEQADAAQRQSDYEEAVAKANAEAEVAIVKAQADAQAEIAAANAKAQEAIERARIASDDAKAQRVHDKDMKFLDAQARLKEKIASALLEAMLATGERGQLPDVRAVAERAIAGAPLPADVTQDVRETADEISKAQSGAVTPETAAAVREVAAEIDAVVKFLSAKRKPVRDANGNVTAIEVEGHAKIPVQTDASGRIKSVGGVNIKRRGEGDAE